MRGAGATMQRDVEQLVAKVARADRAAFDSLYTRLAPRVWPALLRISPDQDSAEDRFQTVFVRIWQEAGLYRGPEASSLDWIAGLVGDAAEPDEAGPEIIQALYAAAEGTMPPPQLRRRIDAQLFGRPRPGILRMVLPYGAGAVLAAAVAWVVLSTGVLLPS